MDGYFALEVLLQDLIVLFDHGFDELLAPFFDDIGHVGGNLGDREVFRRAGRTPDVGFAFEQVDDALEFVLDADRQHHHHRLRGEYFLDLFDDPEEVGADPVELVYENDPRDLGIVRVTPVGFRLWLHAARTAEHAYAAVEHLQ